MADIYRIRCTWTGFKGAPGVSTFYAESNGMLPNLGALHNAFDAWHYALPTGLNVHIENQGDILDDATGAITGDWSQVAVADVQGSGGTAYSGAEGVLITWDTSGIHNHRHLRGKTFLVPIVATQFTAAGVVPTNLASTIQTGANYIANATDAKFVVWGRPKAGAGGTSSQITGARVNSTPAVLRSRRD